MVSDELWLFNLQSSQWTKLQVTHAHTHTHTHTSGSALWTDILMMLNVILMIIPCEAAKYQQLTVSQTVQDTDVVTGKSD